MNFFLGKTGWSPGLGYYTLTFSRWPEEHLSPTGAALLRAYQRAYRTLISVQPWPANMGETARKIKPTLKPISRK